MDDDRGGRGQESYTKERKRHNRGREGSGGKKGRELDLSTL